MNCSEFSELAFDLARNEGLDEATRQKALAHADACPRCDEELVMARSLTQALRSLAASNAGAGAPPRIEETLLDEMRRRNQPVAIRRPSIGVWAFGGVVGLAATVLISVVLLKPEILHFRAVPGSGVSSPSATAPSASTGNNAGANSANASSDASAQDEDSEDATDYVALTSADDSTYAEDQTIVRVSMPPSALASFGLPVSSDGRDSNVTADFVLGEDGMPQAVRLVQSR